LLGRVAPYSTIDINQGHIVSVSENGKGVLNHIKYVKTKNLNLQTYNQSNSSMPVYPINFEEISKISVSNDIDSNKNPVTIVQIVTDYDIIIIG
jgi:hypothetical protein